MLDNCIFSAGVINLKISKAFFRSGDVLNMRDKRCSVERQVNSQRTFKGTTECVPSSDYLKSVFT
jgi:hypothetical protein